jgi:hypothetical protein
MHRARRFRLGGDDGAVMTMGKPPPLSVPGEGGHIREA